MLLPHSSTYLHIRAEYNKMYLYREIEKDEDN